VRHLGPVVLLRLTQATRLIVTAGLVTHRHVCAISRNIRGGAIATLLLGVVGAQVLRILGRGGQAFTLNHHVAEAAWLLLLGGDCLLQVLVLQDSLKRLISVPTVAPLSVVSS
jgi:hypothetical protein